ncbi:MAG: ATP synthase F1 subunit delta [Lachnospiraceae bacterium]|nr:ATP synthase F1 subunit delta [uncultured Acetatifactor sp.]MCI9221034.1 ATP synthase F1 subunit delta [Lachnospiraceae bacterium]
MAKLVSKTYGEALYEVAAEAGKTSELMEEIRCVREILASNPGFDELMEHPGVPKQEKLQIVENVFKGRLSDELTGLLEVVVSKERYRDLPAIFAYFTEKVKEEQRIAVAWVTTAVELAPGQREAVKTKLLETSGYASMEMHYEVDASIIGGMIIRIGDRVVDSSVRTKLDGLKKQLLQIQLG